MKRIYSMKKTNIISVALLVAAVLAALTPLNAATAEFAIHDGDRVVFLGDSITEQRLYTTAIEAYTLARFPQWKLTFRNIFFHRWREVQLSGPPEAAKPPPFETEREKDLARLDEQIAQLETRINTARQPQPHTFVLKPAAPSDLK